MRTEYASVRFCYVGRVLPGKPITEIEARDGRSLIRVTEEGRDDLYIVGTGITGIVEIPWSNVASAQRAASSPKGKGA